jgi:phage terminase Nu1 subunit (DNA packaging protein)
MAYDLNYDDLLRGRKEICAFLKVSWQTVRRWQRFGLPIRRLPNGKPLMLKHEVIQWIVLLDEKADKGAAKGLQKGSKRVSNGG